jgi:hypothetical protein
MVCYDSRQRAASFGGTQRSARHQPDIWGLTKSMIQKLYILHYIFYYKTIPCLIQQNVGLVHSAWAFFLLWWGAPPHTPLPACACRVLPLQARYNTSLTTTTTTTTNKMQNYSAVPHHSHQLKEHSSPHFYEAWI